MSKVRFAILATLLACNAVALFALARLAFRKPSLDTPHVIGLQLGRTNVQNGIQLCEVAKDGATEAAEMNGSECRVVQRRSNAPAYMYFAVEPASKRLPIHDAVVTVEYFDYAPGEFRLNYDAVDLEKNRPSPYMLAEEKEKCLGSQNWQKATFLIRHARLQNAQNGGADFRLELRLPELYVRRVSIQPLK